MMDVDVLEEKKKYFSASGEKTFQYDDTLPNLPVPKLEQTLKKYLDSVKPFVTEDEYLKTEKIVQDFKNGVGQDLQFKLLERSKHQRNWLEKWWEDNCYLRLRIPMVPYMSISGSYPHTNYSLPPEEGSQCQRAALFIHFYLKYWVKLRKENLIPQKYQNKYFSMDQWRRLFNCCRIPGLSKDKFVKYFKSESEGKVGPTHVTVMHRGYAYSFDVFDLEENPLNPPEIESQLRFICDDCKSLKYGPSVAALTCDERTSWFHNRQHLMKLDPENERILQCIESSLFVIILDERSPSMSGQVLLDSFGGDIRNRWADKSLQLIIYSNGLIANNNDHAPYDAMPMVSLNYYTYLNVLKNNYEWMGNQLISTMKKPCRLEFKLDTLISKKIQVVQDFVNPIITNLDVKNGYFVSFGKDFLFKQHVRPDTFVQMALQLAYYRQHHCPAPTYETASTRQFWHGRTETVRSCSLEAVNWVQSMLDMQCMMKTKFNLLGLAIEKHNKLMDEAMQNEGCDRHLLGLYLMAEELGTPTSPLFLDPSYSKSGGNGNFVLSTSLSGYSAMQGGVAPMVENGYGIFYSLQKNSISFVITVWKSSKETDSKKLYKNICLSLIEMQRLFLTPNL